MTEKEKLYYLITEFTTGNYNAKEFCEEFSTIYNTKINYAKLNKTERQYFSDLSEITNRFSQYEDELVMPNMYYSAADVRKAAEKVMVALSI